MPSETSILRLMNVPAANHDLAWLKDALRAAIRLEFATIPPYLCARWSMKAGSATVAQSLREIFREEMLHMGLGCNLLVALGEMLSLNSPEFIPTYPGPLPGGVLPGLIVPLQGLTLAAVKLFMDIELPQFPPVALTMSQSFTSIGQFYSAILAAFEANNPTFSLERQREGPLGLFRIENLDDARRAIELIQRQGEGSSTSPIDGGSTDMAHFYRFKEIHVGKKLVYNPTTQTWEFTGANIPFPDAWPMAEVPAGGYRQADVPAEVWALLDEFDRTYTEMLNQLQLAWYTTDAAEGDQALNDSVGTMFNLRTPAVELMKIPIGQGPGTYGPCFRLSPA